MNDKNSGDEIIKNHVIWASGGGAIPIPIIDFVSVLYIQLDMVNQLCILNGVDFKKSKATSIVGSLIGTSLARFGASSLFKAIPGLGSFWGGLTMSIMSGASTYALGKVLDNHFKTGGTLNNFNTKEKRNFFKQKVKEGKSKTKEWKNNEEKIDALFSNELLKKKCIQLNDMREAGIISKEECYELKVILLDKYEVETTTSYKKIKKEISNKEAIEQNITKLEELEKIRNAQKDYYAHFRDKWKLLEDKLENRTISYEEYKIQENKLFDSFHHEPTWNELFFS